MHTSKSHSLWVISLEIVVALYFIALNGVILAGSIIQSMIVFTDVPTDGPFQLFNPMRRIAAGLPIEYFHGKALPYLHFPLFWLFGQSIFASEFSRVVISYLASWMPLLLFSHAFFKSKPYRLIFLLMVVQAVALSGFLDLLLPPASLRSIRSAMPIVAFAILVMHHPPRRKALSVGIAMALALLLGTEHGSALIISFITVSTVFFIFKPQARKQTLLFALQTLGIMGITALLVLTILSGGITGALTTLRYNFSEVPLDQFWYFGAPPNPFVGSWADISLVVALMIIVVLVLSILPGRRILTHSERIDERYPVLLMLLVYSIISGMVPLLGILLAEYIAPLLRGVAMVAVVIVLDIVASMWIEVRPSVSRMLTRQSNAYAGVAMRGVVLILVTLPLFLSMRAVLVPRAAAVVTLIHETDFAQGVPRVDAYWTEYLQSAIINIESHRRGDPLVIWSTYSSLLHDHYSLLNPAEDYIIHALGPQRRAQYLAKFDQTQPEFVETMRLGAFGYEDWLRKTTWHFYDRILLNYDIITLTKHSILWQRGEESWQLPDDACTLHELNEDQTTFDFPVPQEWLAAGKGLIAVKATYQVNNPWSRLPLIGSTPRYMVLIDSTQLNLDLMLPPYQTEFEFPILVEAGETIRLDFMIASLLPDQNFRVDSLCIHPVPVTEANQPFLEP